MSGPHFYCQTRTCRRQVVWRNPLCPSCEEKRAVLIREWVEAINSGEAAVVVCIDPPPWEREDLQ